MNKIPENWKEVKLGDVVETVIDNRGKNPPYYSENGIPVIDNFMIKNSRFVDLAESKRYIDKNVFSGFIRKHISYKDVLLTLVGNGYGNVAQAPKESAVIIQNTIGLRGDKIKIINDFIFYCLKFNKEKIVNFDRGAAQPSIKVSDLQSLNLLLPPLEVQGRIAAVLGALDDKIENNNRINQNLEAQAMAIFKSWFVDKEKNAFLSDILEEMPKSKIKVGDAKDIKIGCPFFTSGKSILKYTEALVNGRHLFLNTGGNADVKFYIGEASYSTDTWCIKARNDLTDMLYLLLKNMQKEIDLSYFEGSALKHLQKQKLKNLRIYLPTNEEINNFNKAIVPIFDKISSNAQENERLAGVRDALLPKLLSGEITPPETTPETL